MTNSSTDLPTLKQLVKIVKKWFSYIADKWIFITLLITFGAIIGFSYAWFRKPNYTAACTFVLEEESKGGLAQYAGLAAMVGIDLGATSGGIFQGDNIIELYRSRLMLQKVLLTEATFENKKQLLLERYIQFNKLSEKLKNVNKEDFNFNANRLTKKQDSILSLVVKNINKYNLQVARPDKKLSIIRVTYKGRDELFAKEFTDAIVATVNSFYTATKTKKASENVAILQHQADSVKRILNLAIGSVAYSIDENPNSNPAMQRLRIPSQKKQVDVQASAAVYTEIVKNLEIARISFRKEKPLIQVIDKPILPLEDDNIEKEKGLVMGAFLSLIAGLIYLSLRYVLDEGGS